MDKTQEEQEIEKKISQYQNRQKILLNKKRTEEHRARTHRLIGRGALLEAVFPAVVEMEGEEVKRFLSPSPACQGRRSWRKKHPKTRLRSNPQSEWRTYTPSRCRAPCRGLLRPSDAMGVDTPKPPHPRQKVTPAARLSLSGGANIQH